MEPNFEDQKLNSNLNRTELEIINGPKKKGLYFIRNFPTELNNVRFEKSSCAIRLKKKKNSVQFKFFLLKFE